MMYLVIMVDDGQYDSIISYIVGLYDNKNKAEEIAEKLNKEYENTKIYFNVYFLTINETEEIKHKDGYTYTDQNLY